jgi:hypothetical protein
MSWSMIMFVVYVLVGGYDSPQKLCKQKASRLM